ncbi:MAG: ABC transporter permease [Lachnospiraceae bacterium]|nr:ABC transporter permease [Lachnospiraceae bacterium]
MITYFLKYYDKLITALLEHLQLVFISLLFSLVLAAIITTLCLYFDKLSKIMLSVTSMIYSVPSLAMFAILIPLTGLGKTTAIIVLVVYNQYLLLRNFLTGLNEVDRSVIEAATGMGMKKSQTLILIQIPLAKKALFTGVRLALVSTIGIATIAASINAGGLGTILFDGLRTMNTNKIIWGSILAAGLAVVTNYTLDYIERTYDKRQMKESRS